MIRHASPGWIRLLLCGCMFVLSLSLSSHSLLAQASSRKVKTRVEPLYPELAKRNNIYGSARMELLVTPEGRVKNIKVLGGNPVLVQAAVEAVTKWKYEPGPEESVVVVKIDFTP